MVFTYLKFINVSYKYLYGIFEKVKPHWSHEGLHAVSISQGVFIAIFLLKIT